MNDPLSQIIAFVLMNFTATFTVVGLVIAVVIIAVRKRKGYDLWVTLLNWFLLVGIGITYIYNGIMHTVFGDLSASLIGWENNGFQAEVGYASLGMAHKVEAQYNLCCKMMEQEFQSKPSPETVRLYEQIKKVV